MDSKTKATLLQRLRDGGDPLAWEESFQRYRRLLFGLARQRGCSNHTAEEVVQEVMLAVFHKRDVFRYDPVQGRFRDWLATIVRNQVARRVRRQPSRRVRAGGGSSECTAAPVAAAVVGLVVALGTVVAAVWPGLYRPSGVDVNFITEPYEATIYLDGRQLLDTDQVPYRMPCTVPNLPPRVYHVVFKHAGCSDLDAGPIDFARDRELVVRWSTAP